MKDNNCAGFVNAFGAAFILVAFIVHPILALIVLILWIAGASLESRIRDGKRISSPAYDELQAARRRAIKIGVGLAPRRDRLCRLHAGYRRHQRLSASRALTPERGA